MRVSMSVSQIGFLVAIFASIVHMAHRSYGIFMQPVFWGGMSIGVLGAVVSPVVGRVVIKKSLGTSN